MTVRDYSKLEGRVLAKTIAFGQMYGAKTGRFGSLSNLPPPDEFRHVTFPHERFDAFYGVDRVAVIRACRLVSSEEPREFGQDVRAPWCPRCEIIMAIAAANGLDMADPLQYQRAHHIAGGFT